MATFLNDIFAFYNSNTALKNACPYSNVWLSMVPPGVGFPRIVIVPITLVPTFLTGNAHFESYSFQVSVYGTTADSVDSILSVVTAQFDFAPIATGCISCIRIGGGGILLETLTPENVYHGWVDYEYTRNTAIL